MGSSVSHAAAPPPAAYGAPPPFAAADAAPPPKPHEEEVAEEKVDYLNLPCPVPYEEIQREAFSKSASPSLPPSLFDLPSALSIAAAAGC
jgi:mitochondrial import receptor subunit TOM40